MYKDRVDAGRQLIKAFVRFRDGDSVVLAPPSSGVVFSTEVAKELDTPLGAILVRKIGHPADYEYTIDAVAEDKASIYNQDELRSLDKEWLKKAEISVRQLIEQRREHYYGRDLTPPGLKGEAVIVIDDGIATGLTMEAAARVVKNNRSKQLIAAVPVAPPDSVNIREDITDEVIILNTPESFLGSIGDHYRQFNQIDDEEVRAFLREV